MSRLKEAAIAREAPEDHLRLALTAESAKHRAQHARAGLAIEDVDLTPDTHVLLLRQLYLAHLEMKQLRKAAHVAEDMVRVGALPDIAHHDCARILFAIGEEEKAIQHQRLASRHAPASRRSFHLWSLATLQHFAGHHEDALSTLRRAERWATRDRPLLRAHAAYVELDGGGVPEDLLDIVRELEGAKCREGYGEYLLGMIAIELGDRRKAAGLLRAFLRRNAAINPAKALTLREELRRVCTALARIESD